MSAVVRANRSFAYIVDIMISSRRGPWLSSTVRYRQLVEAGPPPWNLLPRPIGHKLVLLGGELQGKASTSHMELDRDAINICMQFQRVLKHAVPWTAVTGGDGHEHKGDYQKTLLKMCGRVGPQTPNVETATNNSAELVAFTAEPCNGPGRVCTRVTRTRP